jgi:N-acetylglucosaminyldiphosphoundecaprenol N-acetyl-beta-D-mannosaminyltransferase
MDHSPPPGTPDAAPGASADPVWDAGWALGLVNSPDRAALLADLAARIAAGRGFTLATLNLDHLVKLRTDGAFRAAYGAHSHVVADGNPVVWLRRMAGRPVRLVPGSELVWPLCRMAAQAGLKVALIGSTEPALARAAERLEKTYPGLEIVLRLAPSFGFDPDGAEAGACIDRLEAGGIGLCLIALGAPRQERFAIRAAARLPGTGFASIGAGLDFIAGTQRRAPRLMRKLALEWLWRMASDPLRLTRRYAACFAILPGMARSARQLGRKTPR